MTSQTPRTPACACWVSSPAVANVTALPLGMTAPVFSEVLVYLQTDTSADESCHGFLAGAFVVCWELFSAVPILFYGYFVLAWVLFFPYVSYLSSSLLFFRPVVESWRLRHFNRAMDKWQRRS